jgi:hypothetical protein
VTKLGCLSNQHREAPRMLYAGLDLSRQRLDVHVLDEEGRTVEVMAVHPDADALRTLASRVLRHGHPCESQLHDSAPSDRAAGGQRAIPSPSQRPRCGPRRRLTRPGGLRRQRSVTAERLPSPWPAGCGDRPASGSPAGSSSPTLKNGEGRGAHLSAGRVDAPLGLMVLLGPQRSPRDRNRSLAVAQGIEGTGSGGVDQPSRRRFGPL